MVARNHGLWKTQVTELKMENDGGWWRKGSMTSSMRGTSTSQIEVTHIDRFGFGFW